VRRRRCDPIVPSSTFLLNYEVPRLRAGGYRRHPNQVHAGVRIQWLDAFARLELLRETFRARSKSITDPSVAQTPYRNLKPETRIPENLPRLPGMSERPTLPGTRGSKIRDGVVKSSRYSGKAVARAPRQFLAPIRYQLFTTGQCRCLTCSRKSATTAYSGL